MLQSLQRFSYSTHEGQIGLDIFQGERMMVEVKKSRGRPVEKSLPPSIPDTPENIARACMQGPPKKKWDFLKKKAAK